VGAVAEWIRKDAGLFEAQNMSSVTGASQRPRMSPARKFVRNVKFVNEVGVGGSSEGSPRVVRYATNAFD